MRALLPFFLPLLMVGGCDSSLPLRFSTSTLSPGQTLKVEFGRKINNVHLRMNDGTSVSVYNDASNQGRGLIGIPLNTSSGPFTIAAVPHGFLSLFQTVQSSAVVVLSSERKTEPLHFDSDKSKLLFQPGMLIESKIIHDTLARGEKDHEQKWRGLFQKPVHGQVLSAFGTPRSKNSVAVNDVHRGVDLASEEGTPVHAPNAGTVILVRSFRYHGNMVLISHGQGVGTLYLHLSSATVAEGQYLKPGDQIGLVGHTGLATGPHLHWGLYVHGEPVNPMQWLEQEF